MKKTVRRPHDAFTFSLGGLRTIAPVVAAPIIADNLINRVRDDRDSRRGRRPRWAATWRAARRSEQACEQC